MLAGAAVAVAAPAWAGHAGRVAAIGWRGTARVFQDEATLDLTVRTRIEPFRRARSTSWLTDRGEATARTLVIEPGDGWLERGGKRQPLPALLVAHERQQYGIYAYLLGLAPSHREGQLVHAAEPGFPPIRIEVSRGRAVAADYTVASDADGRPLPQHFTFDGTIDRDGVRWFRHMTIVHSGRPYFELTLTRLSVERG